MVHVPDKVGQYKLGEKVGEGTFGKVYIGTHEDSGAKVAVKRVASMTWDVAKREIDTLKVVQGHANILALLEYKTDEENLLCWIITELCDLGNLTEYSKRYLLDNRHKLIIMVQCSNALEYLHSLSPLVVHRDMKPENVLMKMVDGQHIAKIADFGVSKVIETFANLKTFTDWNTPLHGPRNAGRHS